MDPALEIKMVRENLALALGIWAAVKKGALTPLHLPEGRVVVTSEAGRAVEVPNSLEISSEKELVRYVSNQARGAFAFSVLHTYRTLDSLCSVSPLQEPDPDLQAARCAIYLLNNSLGQDMLTPVWACPAAYRRRFEVQPISFVLDASDLDGKPVSWDDFGGLDQYLDLLDYCGGWLEKAAAGTAGSTDKKVTAAQLLDDQPSQATTSSEPVAQFIEARCVVGPEAQTMASHLYADYLAWCRETGHEALVQRAFGMRLTALGYQRRRRGRGRHWWQGIQPA